MIVKKLLIILTEISHLLLFPWKWSKKNHWMIFQLDCSPSLPTEPNSDFGPRGLLLSLRNCLSENWSYQDYLRQILPHSDNLGTSFSQSSILQISPCRLYPKKVWLCTYRSSTSRNSDIPETNSWLVQLDEPSFIKTS